jgi:hypothetical protein
LNSALAGLTHCWTGVNTPKPYDPDVPQTIDFSAVAKLPGLATTTIQVGWGFRHL